MSKRQQRSIESQVQEHIEKYFLLEELTNSSKPPAIPTDRWKIERMADAEIAAEQLRNDWNLGGDPIPNVTELLEGKGIKVMFLEFANDYNGSSLWVNESIPVIICNRAFPGDRQRFTLVHELAHMVLDLDGGEKDEEKVCHRFAAAFLAPRKAMFEKIGKKNEQQSIWMNC